MKIDAAEVHGVSINEFKELVADPLFSELANIGLMLIDAGNADEWWFDANAAPSPFSGTRAPSHPRQAATTTTTTT